MSPAIQPGRASAVKVRRQGLSLLDRADLGRQGRVKAADYRRGGPIILREGSSPAWAEIRHPDTSGLTAQAVSGARGAPRLEPVSAKPDAPGIRMTAVSPTTHRSWPANIEYHQLNAETRKQPRHGNSLVHRRRGY